jgi:hypothetical protein
MSWRKLMSFLGIAPRDIPPLPKEYAQREAAMHAELMDAGKRHKAASDLVIKTSLDEVERARDVSVAIHTIMGRLEPEDDAALRTAQGALDIITKRTTSR